MEAILGGSFIIGAAACWRWATIDKQAIAYCIAHRLLAWVEGDKARIRAKAEAMAKEVRLG